MEIMSNCQPRRLINIVVLEIVTDFHSGKASHTYILLTILTQYHVIVTDASFPLTHGIVPRLGISLV